MTELVNMVKITALSKFGFKLSNSDDWIKCDKSLLNTTKFQTLSKGDDIIFDEESFNPEGFLLTFSKLDVPSYNKKDLGKGGSLSPNAHLTNTNSLSISPSVPIKKDRIMFGQCVNIAFNKLIHENANFNFNPGDKFVNIVKGFDDAELIYNEYVKRC